MEFNNKEVEKATIDITKEYLSNLIQLMSFDGEKEELNYFKIVIDTPRKGKYLLHLQHIEGEKIKLLKMDKNGNTECERCGLLYSTKGCTEAHCAHFNEDLIK